MSEKWRNLYRIIFSVLSSMALAWVALHYFWDFERVPLEQRPDVVARNAWMLVPVVILALPVVLLDGSLWTRLAGLFYIFGPEQVGITALFIMAICAAFVLLWFFAGDPKSKELFADGIKTTIGAAVGAVIEHRSKVVNLSSTGNTVSRRRART